MPQNKQKQHILITGATGGIGSALAKIYASPEVRLSIFGRDVDKLEKIAKQCQDLGAEVATYTCDLRAFAELRLTINKIDTECPVDLVIANAGVAVYLDSQVDRESWEQIEETIDINLTSAIATVTPLIASMQQRQKGQIALVSSMAAYRGIAVSPSYCASKAGLKAYAESLRLLLKKANIKVSVICPGFVESAMSARFPGPKPFLLSAPRAAVIIKKGLQKNQGNITFPRLLGFGTRALTVLPDSIVGFILKKLSYTF
ncbi:MAG: short-chain dehydrogenase [Legionellales bacterium RIFCSPHIGHO2_12_FULL_37_14]|nr:MAG: short-chain dehydrogenase [Legionellales bacterium RIFCSPHIGHO2_12_FULL_37_14]